MSVRRWSALAATIPVVLALWLPAAAPASAGQLQANSPDPAQIALSQADLDGWQQTDGVRDESWDLSQDASAPNAPSQLYAYQTQFARTRADASRATTGAAFCTPRCLRATCVRARSCCTKSQPL